ncbi:cytochrome C [Thiorhodococcus mannitoliphagus]|uniref:Cytochrome C n=1 Tax=Thiorhodococcus mannitoliphagus TaxID=329406 RepID=A0A6P1DPH0_9GAMM|nr:cytochrome C [Thiorhodococcus mannitoliphagus]NEX20167.1 cytochrome C [Thiorhodococcus mannitoliphagus]
MPHFQRLYPLLAIAVLSLGSVSLAFSDSDDDDEHERNGGWLSPRADVAPVYNSIYAEECGACHMAYQPGLLPANAWAQIMNPAALTDHYGDDASLSEALRAELAAYLTDNASDFSSRTRSRAFAVSLDSGDNSGESLPRISTTAYFVRKHDELSPRMVKDNPEVGSFSQCNRCHQGATKGIYNEDQVRIPGYGRWED